MHYNTLQCTCAPHIERVRKFFFEGQDARGQIMSQQPLQQRFRQRVSVAGVPPFSHACAENDTKRAQQRALLVCADSKGLHAVVQPETRCLALGLPGQQKQRWMAVP
jgi:hypothetical protein